MAGRSRPTATPAQVVALRELARSAIRGEADRARAILLTLDGRTGVELAQAFGVTAAAASVRHWRARSAAGGVEALRATPAPGPSPEKRPHLAPRTFADADHLERAIHEAVGERNRQRAHPGDNLQTAA